MKKSLAMASLLALGTSAVAVEVQPFVGVGFERGDMNGKYSYSQSNGYSESDSISDDASDLKLKLGAILEKTHRVSLSHINYGIEGGGDFRIILGNYDYLVPMNDKFKLLAGLHIGNANYEIDDFKMSGLAYGLQVGGIYDITKNIEFELGLAYTQYNLDKNSTGTVLGIDWNEKVELEDSTSMFIGINYKF
ncbi:hypothetical protein CRU94_09230 [Arcobacter sp. AHV-9/2010]|uniref:hypothetical protein n=1 Tax=Arcobacter sp. AHV-9/2010 TaxID=2021861 RepID=UPI00100C1455|nr:hypothetical protein [Arcobacter sp. CECT 9299]RXJ94093.1 hypothetical protein CRU94_09230 [Arcobacter sp. CECT 9299]